METLDDTLASDVACLVGVDPAEIANDPFPMASVVAPAEWYGPPQDAEIEAMRGNIVDNRAMMLVDVCGVNSGQAQTLVAEDGVPFTGAYTGLPAPILEGADFRFIHDRPENALQVVDADGSVVAISAGKAGPRHSPDDIESLDALLEWHDRLDVPTTFSDEGVLFRYRLHLVEQDGHELLVARGGLVPGIRWADVFQVMQSEVSPEFLPVETDNGILLEYAALSLVFHGNTNTTLSLDRAGLVAPERPQIRLIAGTVFDTPTGGETMTINETLNVDVDLSKARRELEEFFTEIETRGIDRAAMLKACGATPCGPCAAAASTDDATDTEPDEDAELSELEKVTAERDALLAEQYEAITVDTTPLVPTDEEIRERARKAEVSMLLEQLADLRKPNKAAIRDTALSRLIDDQFNEDNETRQEFYERISDNAGISPSTVRQIVAADIMCPPPDVLVGIASTFSGVSIDEMVAAAKSDGCTRYDNEDNENNDVLN